MLPRELNGSEASCRLVCSHAPDRSWEEEELGERRDIGAADVRLGAQQSGRRGTAVRTPPAPGRNVAMPGDKNASCTGIAGPEM